MYVCSVKPCLGCKPSWNSHCLPNQSSLLKSVLLLLSGMVSYCCTDNVHLHLNDNFTSTYKTINDSFPIFLTTFLNAFLARNMKEGPQKLTVSDLHGFRISLAPLLSQALMWSFTNHHLVLLFNLMRDRSSIRIRSCLTACLTACQTDELHFFLIEHCSYLSQARSVQLAIIQRDNMNTRSTVPGHIVIRVFITKRVLKFIRFSAPMLRELASVKSLLWRSITRHMR